MRPITYRTVSGQNIQAPLKNFGLTENHTSGSTCIKNNSLASIFLTHQITLEIKQKHFSTSSIKVVLSVIHHSAFSFYLNHYK